MIISFGTNPLSFKVSISLWKTTCGSTVESMQLALIEIRKGASLGATLKRDEWTIKKEALHVGDIAAGPRFLKLAQLDENQDLAISIYRLSASREKRRHEVATVIEIYHPAYLDLEELRELVPAASLPEPSQEIRELLRLAASEMEEE